MVSLDLYVCKIKYLTLVLVTCMHFLLLGIPTAKTGACYMLDKVAGINKCILPILLTSTKYYQESLKCTLSYTFCLLSAGKLHNPNNILHA